MQVFYFQLVVDALPVEPIGMNGGLMCDFIELCAGGLHVALKAPTHYNAGNPFEWMEMIYLQGKANFFEKRVVE